MRPMRSVLRLRGGHWYRWDILETRQVGQTPIRQRCVAVARRDNLAWYGFVPIINPEPASPGSPTSLSYYAPNFKGSYDWLISWILHMDRSSIALVEDGADYAYNYRAVVGDDYDPCLNPFFAPQSLIP